MNCREHEANLMPWIDGAADAATDAAMREHERTCAECRGRGAAEREFEREVAASLLRRAGAPDGAEWVRRAMSPDPAPRRASGRLRWMRPAAAIAASVVAAVAGAWYLCIPPFECPYLQAVEATAGAPQPTQDDGADFGRLDQSVRAPDSILDLRRAAAPERTHVDVLDLSAPALRARYSGPAGGVTVVWSDARGEEPSFRRRTQRGGLTWWIADENDRRLVAFVDDATGVLCTLVAPLPEEDLLRYAGALRDTSR